MRQETIDKNSVRRTADFESHLPVARVQLQHLVGDRLLALRHIAIDGGIVQNGGDGQFQRARVVLLDFHAKATIVGRQRVRRTGQLDELERGVAAPQTVNGGQLNTVTSCAPFVYWYSQRVLHKKSFRSEHVFLDGP